MKKIHKLIKLAYEKGYRVTDDGRVISPKGKERKIKVTETQRYPRFTINCGNEFSCNGTYRIPAHIFSAYCFYGDEVFNEGLEVRHLNEDRSDLSKDNIALGTHTENEMDKPKEVRVNVAKIDSEKLKGKIPSNARFTKEEIIDIKTRLQNGERAVDIATDYNIHRTYIYNIKNEVYYKNIKIEENPI